MNSTRIFGHHLVVRVNMISSTGMTLSKNIFSIVKVDLNKFMPLHEQAKKLIYEALDVDDSGSLSAEEISDVLIAWGIPQKESMLYMQKFDKDCNGVNDLDEFIQYFHLCGGMDI